MPVERHPAQRQQREFKPRPTRKLLGFLSRKSFERAHKRYACDLDGTLTILEYNHPIRGSLMDLSRQGGLFRPYSKFVMIMNGLTCTIRVGDTTLNGTIVNTMARGYGVRFDRLYHKSFPVELINSLSIDPDDVEEAQTEFEAERDEHH